jgi:hypothetical protein
MREEDQKAGRYAIGWRAFGVFVNDALRIADA